MSGNAPTMFLEKGFLQQWCQFSSWMRCMKVGNSSWITKLWMHFTPSTHHIWVSFCRTGKTPVSCPFFWKVEPSCDKTWYSRVDFSIVSGKLGLVHQINTSGPSVKIFLSPVEHLFFSLIWHFLAIFEVRIKPSCDHTFTAGPNLMCPSS